MKKAIITLATSNILSQCADFLNNQRAYARANGYEHILFTDVYWPLLHPSFSKVHYIRKALQDYEIVIWNDADVAYMNFNVDLAQLLNKPGIFLAAYQQTNWQMWKYLCAGLTVWRSCPEATKYVEEWYLRCEIGTERISPGKRVVVTYPPWEQWYMDEINRETEFHGIYAATGDEIGCFCPEVWHDGTIWHRGMPTIHFAGQCGWERRAEIFRDTYASQVIKKKSC